MTTRTEPSSARAKQTLDEMMASRTAKKLPAAPVFTREVVAVPEVGRGKKGASDLEAAIRTNAEAAQEARRVALAQREALEEIAAQRVEIEKQLAGLRREMAEERSEHERLVAQARFRATQEERRRHETSPDAPASVATGDSVIASPAMRAVQGQIAEREQLGDSHRQRLLEALRERDATRLELQRVSDARTHAERRLERVTEVLHRATSSPGPRPAGDDGVETQAVRGLRDELAVAIARAKSAESRTNELRDEIEAVKGQRGATTESLEATRDDLETARDELASLHAQLIGLEAEQRTGAPDADRVELAQARARELEAEVHEVYERAAAAERQVSELTASLQSTTNRADLSLAVTHDVQGELAEARARYTAAEDEVIEVASRARQVEAEFRARTSELEAQLDSAVIEHGNHAVDLEATHAATAAELTSASAQAEHLAHEIDDAQARVGQLETALAATTAELADTADRLTAREAEFADARDRLAARDSELADLADRLQVRDAAHSALEAQLSASVDQLDRQGTELDDLASELSTREVRLEQLEAAWTTAVDESSAALARAEASEVALDIAQRDLAVADAALATALEESGTAAAVADAALGTARAERDVAVAQADSLTLELEQQQAARQRAEGVAAEHERLHLEVETEHGDALTRLDELSRELGVLRADREVLVEWTEGMAEQTEHLQLELAAARVRADDLEAIRSEDRRVAEQAVGALRAKTETATARASQVESEMQELRSRHGDERDRFARDLDAAQARADEEERQRLADDLAAAQVRVADVEREMDTVRVDVATLERKLNTVRVDAAELERERDAARRRTEDVERALEQAASTVPEAPARPEPPRPASPPSRVPAASPTPEPEPTSEAAPEPVVTVAPPAEPPRPPSELRRAVFASLTELAGDG